MVTGHNHTIKFGGVLVYGYYTRVMTARIGYGAIRSTCKTEQVNRTCTPNVMSGCLHHRLLVCRCLVLHNRRASVLYFDPRHAPESASPSRQRRWKSPLSLASSTSQAYSSFRCTLCRIELSHTKCYTSLWSLHAMILSIAVGLQCVSDCL